MKIKIRNWVSKWIFVLWTHCSFQGKPGYLNIHRNDRGSCYLRYGLLRSNGHMFYNLLFLIVSGNWKASCLTTRHQCITIITLGTTAHSQMTSCFADCICAALANAWINARIIETRSIVGAFNITLAFATCTMWQRITGVTWQACTHRTLFASIIVSWNTLCIRTAWIWSAQISWKLAQKIEWKLNFFVIGRFNCPCFTEN